MNQAQRRPPRFFGARYRGEGHATRHEPCCDALFLAPARWAPSGFVICDGAGGSNSIARGAFIGAQAAWCALRALRRDMRRHPAQDLRLISMQRRFRAAFIQARGQTPVVNHTVLACLWDRQQLLVAQVGDSTLLVKRKGSWEAPLPPAKGEFANLTTFLRPDTNANAIDIWWSPAHQVDAVIGFSDGLEAAFLAPEPGVPENLRPNVPLADLVIEQHRQRAGWRGYPAWLAASLADEGIRELSDDDRTLVIACR